MKLNWIVFAAVLASPVSPSHASWEAIEQVAQPLFVRGGESGVWIATVPYLGHEIQIYGRTSVVLLTSTPNLVYCDGRTENRNFAALAGIRFSTECRQTTHATHDAVLRGDTLSVTVEVTPPPSWTYDESMDDVFAAALWCGLLNARQAWPQVRFVEYLILEGAKPQLVEYQGVYSLVDITPLGPCVKWDREMRGSLTGRCTRRAPPRH